MYQLRAAALRPHSLAAQDPRVLWPKIIPGTPLNETRGIPGGGAFGYVLDGSTTAADCTAGCRSDKGYEWRDVDHPNQIAASMAGQMRGAGITIPAPFSSRP
jgi:hypothetical protein